MFRPTDVPLTDQMRVLAAVAAIHFGTMGAGGQNHPFSGGDEPAEVRRAAVEVAGELIAAVDDG